MGIENFVKDQLVKRETRGKDPAFQAEMAKEKAEFGNILGGLGSTAFEAGVTTLIKTPTELFLKGLKTAYSKNYTMSDWSKDALGLFFGKDGVAHKTLKVAASAVHLAGQGTKIGVRELLKM